VLALVTRLRPSPLDQRRGVVRLHPEALRALGIAPWDVVVLGGRRTTAALVAVAPPGTEQHLLLCDELVLANLGVTEGTTVPVTATPDREAVRVTVVGDPHVVAAVTPEMLRVALLGKALTAGDQVSLLPQDLAPAPGVDVVEARRSLATRLGAAWTSVLLQITEVAPQSPALVTMGTVVGWQGGSTTGSSATPLAAGTATVELPGLDTQLHALTEWLDLGFHHRDLLARLGTSPQLGVLVTGAAGSGKAALVQAVAARLGLALRRVWAPSLAATEPNAAVQQLRALLDAKDSPAVALLEDVETLLPRETTPLSAAVLAAVREAVAGGRVAVVCTTGHPESVTPELRSPGTLDHELAIPLPDRAQRLRLLQHATKQVPLAADVVLEEVAGRTPGFVAADILALVREAGMRAAARQQDAPAPVVAAADLAASLEVVRPTAMGGARLDVATVTLEDVGDMVEVKQAVTEAVLWPLHYPDTFARLGIDPPRGLLLYGPPGCGKTFLVKAIAGSGQVNVLSVKGAEVLSKWVGESERGVRELFRRAREAAPTLVFLDEVDALAPVRGQSTDSGTTDRVVAALLTELDGVEDLRDVVVIGATNRPELVDPALLRPGRLGRLVYVPPPDAEARAAILAASAKDVPLDPAVDLALLGQRTQGYSAADCAHLVREAALAAMRESMAATSVTAAHVETALGVVRPSLVPQQVAALEAFAYSRQA